MIQGRHHARMVGQSGWQIVKVRSDRWTDRKSQSRIQMAGIGWESDGKMKVLQQLLWVGRWLRRELWWQPLRAADGDICLRRAKKTDRGVDTYSYLKVSSHNTNMNTHTYRDAGRGICADTKVNVQWSVAKLWHTSPLILLNIFNHKRIYERSHVTSGKFGPVGVFCSQSVLSNLWSSFHMLH